GTPYQAHRFVLEYLPAVAVLIGIGGATALSALVQGFPGRPAVRIAGRLAAGIVLLGLVAGLWAGQQSVRAWAATQAAWQADEQQVAVVARRAAASATPTA